MDGILVIDKPEGWTSHDVVARIRRIFKTKRVGHTGTLDPFATGVLVVLIGKATRLAQFLDKDEKEYEAEVRFGFETDTGDRTGNARIAECGLRNDEIAVRLAETDWLSVLAKFTGALEQVPPMYSAKKVEGKKLYQLARQGLAVARKPETVVIREIEWLDGETTIDDGTSKRLRVACSAGTYVRQLAEDIGRSVGLGAHLQELRRTRAGIFDLSDCVTIEQLENSSEPTAYLKNIRIAVEHLPAFVLAPDRVEKTKNGLSTRLKDGGIATNGPIRMIDDDGELVAIGFYNETENAIQPRIVLV